MLAVWSFAAPAAILAARAQSEPGLHVLGVIPFGANFDQSPEMIVDSTLHRGYSQAFIGDRLRLVIYDLDRLRVVGTADPPETLILAASVVDEPRHRILFPRKGPFANSCGGTGAPSTIVVFDELARSWSQKHVDCLGDAEFMVRALSMDAASGKLYAFGAPSYEQLTEGQTPDNKSIRFRQIDAATLHTDWDLDASSACNNADNRPFPPLVIRYRDTLLSYCYRSTPAGLQGLAMRIPLSLGRPAADTNGNPVVLTSPTLPQRVAPIVDPGSGRMIIFTGGSPNGQAAWVYDPPNERFFGVIPSGVPNPRGASLFLGLDRVRGRVYILNSRGIVIADGRHDPLPAGVSYPVLDDVRDNNSGFFINVDSTLHRLFVPVLKRKGFVALSDDVPQPVDPSPPDPDRGTADIPEVAGKTDVTFSSGGNAHAVHLLNTGGIPKGIDEFDPFCNDVEGGLNDKDSSGRCPSDQILTPGNREYFVAQSSLELGADSGTSADAAAGRSPSTDSATDSDLRAIGRCEYDKVPVGSAPSPAPSAAAKLCAAASPATGQFASGTQGADGKGFPIAGAVCSDFADMPATDEQASVFGTSTVRCDNAGHTSSATAESRALSLPDAAAPIVTIVRAYSSAEASIDDRGVVTTVTSTVEGVRIAGVTIGRITSTAVVRAHGRTGTSFAQYAKEFVDVQAPGLECARCNEREVVDAINRALGPQVRARSPSAAQLASPHGYQGIVQKDSRLVDSDRTVNDDDTLTVDGLDIIAYNDGKNGRSRLVIGLAGVQAEARYGIFLLPRSGDGTTTSEPGRAQSAPSGSLSGGAGSSLPPGAPAIAQAPAAAPNPISTLGSALHFAVTNPREAGLLFVMWAILASPVYLALRKRARTVALR